MTFNTDAVVLKIVKTGESDRLITFLTKDRGILKAFAKAADRPKNKLHMSSNLFCWGNFTFYEGSKALRVTECDLEETFYSLRNDIKKLALAQYFNELLMEAAPVEAPAEDFLRLYLNTLYFLSEDKKDAHILKPLFELRLISIAGYMPNLIACSNCGEFETDTMYFDFSDGELYCENCKKTGAYPYPLDVISAMRHIVFSPLQKLFTLKASKDTLSSLNQVTEKYIKIKLQKSFKTLDFYNSICD